VYQRFVDAFARLARGIRVGHGLAADTMMGPLANARRLDAVCTAIESLQAAGARLQCGGTRSGGAGLFLPPTLFSDVPVSAAPMREEPFGPLAMITPFASEDEALQLANALPYGLAAYAFTRDGARQLRLSEDIEAGLVGLNTFMVNGPETPWGGVKDSGYGSEGGSEGLAGYQVSKLAVQSSARI